MGKVKKMNFIIFVFIILVMAGAILYTSIYRNASGAKVNDAKSVQAMELYNEIMGFDFESLEAPEDTMEIYLKTVRLLYGNMIFDDELIRNIVDKQRLLLSDQILELNDFESQVAELKRSTDIIYSQNIYCIGWEQKVPVFDNSDTKSCFIRVLQYNSGTSNNYKKYYLNKTEADDKWKITGWEITDSAFRPLVITD